VLSATVPEAKLLLDDVGVPADYPKSMEDVKSLAKFVQALGPRYVLIKREILDEKSQKNDPALYLVWPR
jgi:hydroxymethylpyrimidine/phosphomethylpyrimidine kinase